MTGSLYPAAEGSYNKKTVSIKAYWSNNLNLRIAKFLQVRIFDDTSAREVLSLGLLVFLALVPVRGSNSTALNAKHTNEESHGRLRF